MEAVSQPDVPLRAIRKTATTIESRAAEFLVAASAVALGWMLGGAAILVFN
jgi:cobalamin biosynthesis protein CobD/CbiB